MIEQLMDNYRKASASWLQMQQDAFKQMAQQWLTTPQAPAGTSAEWGRDFQKRWLELAIEALNKHRESLETVYSSGIQIIDQTFRVTDVEAKSTEDYRHLVEDLWRKLFDNFKTQSEAQMRDFQVWAEKSMAIVQNPQA
jgi:ketosteroid isomerase-like protein